MKYNNNLNIIQECSNISEKYNAIRVYNYSCPNCDNTEDNYDLSVGYFIGLDNYPKMFNERKGSTYDGNYWDWDELHCCTKCKRKYWFRNGAY